MTETEWTDILAGGLTLAHVGRLCQVNWHHGHTVTGRLSVVTFAHRHTFYAGGSKELGNRVCRINLEVGNDDFEIDLPPNAELRVSN